MRTVSLAMRTSINAEQTGEIYAFLITVEHETLDAPLHFSSDPTARLSVDPLVYGTVSRGDTYQFLPIDLVLPDDSDGVSPSIQLVLDNVARATVPLLRSISTPADVTVEMVLISDPDTVECTWPNFDLTGADYDDTSVTTTLSIDGDVTEPYPAGSYTPSGFGGLF